MRLGCLLSLSQLLDGHPDSGYDTAEPNNKVAEDLVPASTQHSTATMPVQTPGPGPMSELEQGKSSSSTGAGDMPLGMDPNTFVQKCLREVMSYNQDWV